MLLPLCDCLTAEILRNLKMSRADAMMAEWCANVFLEMNWGKTMLVGFGKRMDDAKALAFDLSYEQNKQANSRDV